MFSDRLTDNLLRICDKERLSYEAAAELCQISSRYFGSVVRKESSPSLDVLEKICRGLHTTPNDLLSIPAPEQLEYRIPKAVVEIKYRILSAHLILYPVCPQCAALIYQEFPNFCCNCGQALSWDSFDSASFIELP